MVEKTFDASRYLVSLKGRDYLEVKWRLLWLRTEHPEAIIETELVRLDQGYAVFKAKVSVSDGGSATGWGSEDVGDFADYLEKAETKALGRALAALGYGTQFTEDFEFHKDGGQAVVDSPVRRTVSAGDSSGRGQALLASPGREPAASDRNRRRQTAAGTGDDGGHPVPMTAPATPAQVNAIYTIGRREYHWSDDETDSQCRNAFSELPVDLLKREASEFIDRLKASAPAA